MPKVKEDLIDPRSGEVVLEKGDTLTPLALERLESIYKDSLLYALGSYTLYREYIDEGEYLGDLEGYIRNQDLKGLIEDAKVFEECLA